MHLSETEKSVYNEYLRVQRLSAKKPFSARKKFDSLDGNTVIVIKAITGFLSRFPYIKPFDFFTAGFADDNGFVPIEFFRSMRAMKMYSVYMYKKSLKPDEEWVLEKIRQSAERVQEFCAEKQVNAKEYLELVSPAGIPWYAIHIKQFEISTYFIFAFPNVDAILSRDYNTIEPILGKQVVDNLPSIRTRFVTSTKCKALARECLAKISSAT